MCYHHSMRLPLSSQPVFLAINGPSCGGKSSVSDILFERYGGLYRAKHDLLKWSISDYHALSHKHIVSEMLLGTMRVALKHGLSVLKESLWDPEPYIRLAREMHVPLVIANIEAPWPILCERFEGRLRRGERMANTGMEEFTNMYAAYRSSKLPTELQFDSSIQSPETIVQLIVDALQTPPHLPYA